MFLLLFVVPVLLAGFCVLYPVAGAALVGSAATFAILATIGHYRSKRAARSVWVPRKR